jgi:hypothetical protein
MNPFVFDLAEITETTEVVIDGHTLWVRPGSTAGGRYWQLLTTSDVPVGMVVERCSRCDGAAVSQFEALVSVSGGPLASATDAARLVLAELCRVGGAS